MFSVWDAAAAFKFSLDGLGALRFSLEALGVISGPVPELLRDRDAVGYVHGFTLRYPSSS